MIWFGGIRFSWMFIPKLLISRPKKKVSRFVWRSNSADFYLTLILGLQSFFQFLDRLFHCIICELAKTRPDLVNLGYNGA